MNHSEQINELAAALSKAQGEITGAVRDSTNPHFRSKYADLSSVWEGIRGPFTKHGLSVVQGLSSTDAGVCCETRILHSSGQWIGSELTIPCDKNNAHGYGSASTYARRFGLQAIAGIAPIDDDGNAAVASAPEPPKTPTELLEKATAEAAKGTAHYKVFYSMLKSDARAQLMPEHENLKKLAAAQTAKNPGDDL
jgi:hypothetical protein